MTDELALLDELVNRAQTGERLLPWPELSQELAFLAFVIDRERAQLAALTDPTDYETIRDDLPENFWVVEVWMQDQNHYPGSVDVADRKRIIEGVLAARLRAVLDSEPETGGGA